MFGILDNQRYDELTTVVTEDAVKVEPQVMTHSAAEWPRPQGVGGRGARRPARHHPLRAGGDDAAIEGYFRGTHSGPLPSPQGPIPATGRQFELRFCGLGRVRDDRISEVHVYFDSMSIMTQVGWSPTPPPPDRHFMTQLAAEPGRARRRGPSLDQVMSSPPPASTIDRMQ
jgi:ketosteroid isomerase-like protein